jgi:aminoglycoside phosphotransferase (APT) family kinase protein
MHGDFAPENSLIHEERLSGVVDWEQGRSGDAGLDLVGMLFDIELGAKATARVRVALHGALRERLPGELLALYVAIFAVRYASWAIGTAMEADVLELGDRLVREWT